MEHMEPRHREGTVLDRAPEDAWKTRRRFAAYGFVVVVCFFAVFRGEQLREDASKANSDGLNKVCQRQERSLQRQADLINRVNFQQGDPLLKKFEQDNLNDINSVDCQRIGSGGMQR